MTEENQLGGQKQDCWPEPGVSAAGWISPAVERTEFVASLPVLQVSAGGHVWLPEPYAEPTFRKWI